MPHLRHNCQPEVSGFLIKARKFPPLKKSFFFRLNGAVLTRHRTKDSFCRERLLVVGATVKDTSKNGFTLSIRHSQHYFYASNPQECTKWIEAIREASTYTFETYYHMRNIIGTGGFATVRLAYEKGTTEKVAVKSISKNRNPDVFLQREVEIMRTVDHPNVVQPFDIFETENSYHIVMEYLSGGSLFDLMKTRKRFVESEVRGMMHQLLEGLAYLHRKGIVHRDLKPENILLTGSKPNLIKIADFGLSKFHEETRGTLMQTMIGTPQFVAPELVHSGAYGMGVDIWAVGMMLFNLLTGTLPFDEDEVLQKYREGNFKIEYKPYRWKEFSAQAMSLTKMMLCVKASCRINAIGALNHNWFASKQRNNRPLSHHTGSSKMKVRCILHVMRFLYRLCARTGMVPMFFIEEIPFGRFESGGSLGSLTSMRSEDTVQDGVGIDNATDLETQRSKLVTEEPRPLAGKARRSDEVLRYMQTAQARDRPVRQEAGASNGARDPASRFAHVQSENKWKAVPLDSSHAAASFTALPVFSMHSRIASIGGKSTFSSRSPNGADMTALPSSPNMAEPTSPDFKRFECKDSTGCERIVTNPPLAGARTLSFRAPCPEGVGPGGSSGSKSSQEASQEASQSPTAVADMTTGRHDVQICVRDDRTSDAQHEEDSVQNTVSVKRMMMTKRLVGKVLHGKKM